MSAVRSKKKLKLVFNFLKLGMDLKKNWKFRFCLRN